MLKKQSIERSLNNCQCLIIFMFPINNSQCPIWFFCFILNKPAIHIRKAIVGYKDFKQNRVLHTNNDISQKRSPSLEFDSRESQSQCAVKAYWVVRCVSICRNVFIVIENHKIVESFTLWFTKFIFTLTW